MVVGVCAWLALVVDGVVGCMALLVLSVEGWIALIGDCHWQC